MNTLWISWELWLVILQIVDLKAALCTRILIYFQETADGFFFLFVLFVFWLVTEDYPPAQTGWRAGLSHINRIRWWTWVPLFQKTHPAMLQATVFVSIIKRACQRAALRRRLPLQYPPKLGDERHCGWAASLQLQSSLPLQTKLLTPAFKKVEITCRK